MQTCQHQKPKMSVTNLKMSENMSVKAIFRSYHGYFVLFVCLFNFRHSSSEDVYKHKKSDLLKA